MEVSQVCKNALITNTIKTILKATVFTLSSPSPLAAVPFDTDI